MNILLSVFLMLFQEGIPQLNLEIIDYLELVKGHKVGDGECWDLAAGALDYSGAYLDRSSQESIYVFGKVYDPKKSIPYPGDIIQFEQVQLEYENEDMIVLETMPHHTAIIYEVLADNHYKIAHQNTRFSGRKVGISELHLDHVKSGRLLFYRPVTDQSK